MIILDKYQEDVRVRWPDSSLGSQIVSLVHLVIFCTPSCQYRMVHTYMQNEICSNSTIQRQMTQIQKVGISYLYLIICLICRFMVMANKIQKYMRSIGQKTGISKNEKKVQIKEIIIA